MEDTTSAFENCRRRYPALNLSFEEFSSRVREVRALGGREEDRAAGASVPLHYEDLFLALACRGGDRIAWEYFMDEYLALLRRFALQACRCREEGEDLAHEIVISLLGDCDQAKPGKGSLDSGGCRPGKLAGYNGRGSLASWLRVIVSRAAVDRFRRMKKQVAWEELEESGREGAYAAGPGEQEESADSRWRDALVEALAGEIDRLAPPDRLLLALYYLHEISLKRIGRQLRVHEATVSRRLDRARLKIRKSVEARLRKQRRFTRGEMEALWRSAARTDNPALEKTLRGLAPPAGKECKTG